MVRLWEVEVFGGRLGMDADGIVDGAVLVWGLPFTRSEDALEFDRLLR